MVDIGYFRVFFENWNFGVLGVNIRDYARFEIMGLFGYGFKCVLELLGFLYCFFKFVFFDWYGRVWLGFLFLVGLGLVYIFGLEFRVLGIFFESCFGKGGFRGDF